MPSEPQLHMEFVLLLKVTLGDPGSCSHPRHQKLTSTLPALQPGRGTQWAAAPGQQSQTCPGIWVCSAVPWCPAVIHCRSALCLLPTAQPAPSPGMMSTKSEREFPLPFWSCCFPGIQDWSSGLQAQDLSSWAQAPARYSEGIKGRKQNGKVSDKRELAG